MMRVRYIMLLIEFFEEVFDGVFEFFNALVGLSEFFDGVGVFLGQVVYHLSVDVDCLIDVVEFGSLCFGLLFSKSQPTSVERNRLMNANRGSLSISII